MVIIAHGLVKENKVPQHDIDLSIKRKEKFKANSAKHTFTKEVNHETS